MDGPDSSPPAYHGDKVAKNLHGDIRWDHIFVDRHTGLYYWIDFDYDFHLPEKPFALDLLELGNLLLYLIGRAITTREKSWPTQPWVKQRCKN